MNLIMDLASEAARQRSSIHSRTSLCSCLDSVVAAASSVDFDPARCLRSSLHMLRGRCSPAKASVKDGPAGTFRERLERPSSELGIAVSIQAGRPDGNGGKAWSNGQNAASDPAFRR